jgi:hypothetical protein
MNTTGIRDGNLVVLANFFHKLSHLRSGHSQRKKGGKSRLEIDHGEKGDSDAPFTKSE